MSAPEPPAPDAPSATPPEPPAPPNKLYEWAAAAAIMLVMGGIAYVFLRMLRSAQL